MSTKRQELIHRLDPEECLAQAEGSFQSALRWEAVNDSFHANNSLGHAVFFEELGEHAAVLKERREHPV